VPGAGEANFDAYVADPFQNAKGRREQEVAALLDKLQPDTIVLDPESVARLRREPLEVQKERAAAAAAANAARTGEQRQENDDKKKMKGKNRPSKRHRKKQGNIIEDKQPEVVKRMREQAERRAAADAARAVRDATMAEQPRALHRFYK